MERTKRTKVGKGRKGRKEKIHYQDNSGLSVSFIFRPLSRLHPLFTSFS